MNPATMHNIRSAGIRVDEILRIINVHRAAREIADQQMAPYVQGRCGYLVKLKSDERL